ncbi:hypothetical protein PSA01_65350 [Pseudonocardia saturnea]|uniref:Zinc finger CGNR domain-containing protein n=1 Tax=Pseudonocardia saturnea TaxID=33909 RepID=A0ABQ0S9H0_9PSEU|nr:hypothetical protein Pdca_15460 [Pseudonocardia autotrophica]GEC29506.1 hypothetical protein PSA01_65350 [Pseudonocardia saturnea]
MPPGCTAEPGRPGGALSVTGTGVDAAPDGAASDRYAARILLAVHTAVGIGRIRRLNLCANDDCRWAFWDASRPGTGRWCSMQVCGGQHKAREYRRRNRTTS